MDGKTQKQNRILAASLVSNFLLGSATAWASVKVTSIDFKSSGSSSLVEIKSDQPLTYEKTDNAQDRQIVIELKSSKLTKNASRKLDTSSFKSKVSLISPYQVEGGGETSRVVIQLREPANGAVSQDGNTLSIRIPNGAAPDRTPPPATGALDPLADASSPANGAESAVPSPEAANGPDPVAGLSQSPAPADASKPEAQASAPDSSVESQDPKRGAEKQLESLMESKKTKRYVGRPISLQVRDMDILDVFQLIGEASGFNVIVGEEVKGKITLSLSDTPWDQALDLILGTRQLGAERHNNVLRITTLTNLTAEKTAELAAKKATEATAPRVTRVFPISYAKLGDLTSVFTKFGSATPGADGTSTVVQADERTNSIIVRDTSENIDRMRKLIEILDTQTPQVLIEAKVVEASEVEGNTLNGQIGFSGTGTDGTGGTSFNGAGLDLLNLSSIGGKDAAGGAAFGLSPSLAFLPGTARLNAFLTIKESEDRIKVIASPRIVVLNKESASIVAGQPVLIPTISQTQNGPITLSTPQQANLSLSVKPTVTNDSGVLMDIQVTRDVPSTINGTTAISNRNVNTKVLIESGSTLVIGGVYSSQTKHSESGFPFLRKIPLIGALFGSESDDVSRSELFIFITPRILNEKEAGLASAN